MGSRAVVRSEYAADLALLGSHLASVLVLVLVLVLHYNSAHAEVVDVVVLNSFQSRGSNPHSLHSRPAAASLVSRLRAGCNALAQARHTPHDRSGRRLCILHELLRYAVAQMVLRHNLPPARLRMYWLVVRRCILAEVVVHRCNGLVIRRILGQEGCLGEDYNNRRIRLCGALAAGLECCGMMAGLQ